MARRAPAEEGGGEVDDEVDDDIFDGVVGNSVRALRDLPLPDIRLPRAEAAALCTGLARPHGLTSSGVAGAAAARVAALAWKLTFLAADMPLEPLPLTSPPPPSASASASRRRRRRFFSLCEDADGGVSPLPPSPRR